MSSNIEPGGALSRDDARRLYDELGLEGLATWSVVERMHDWTSLLLGNGASLAVWSEFGYESLYVKARSQEVSALSDSDEAVFKALDTGNFEQVLSGLKTAQLVGGALGLDTSLYGAGYQSVRDALAKAVHAVHVPWLDLAAPVLWEIKRAIVKHSWVFTTNYDLILYWALMSEEPGAHCDYFWNGRSVFDPRDTQVWDLKTKVLFLHGGLHLYHLSSGETHKRLSGENENLLDLFGTPLSGDPVAVPLFVSEGSADDKLSAIRRSDYLSFAHTQFAELDQPLVVFGHSLSSQDDHIVATIKKRKRPVAVSIRSSSSDQTVAAKNAISARLSPVKPLFFEASSHPLGAASLRV